MFRLATRSFPVSDRPEKTAIGTRYKINSQWKKAINGTANICLNDSELAREKMWSRLHLTPLLQAEEDRDQVRRHYADKAREKELLGTDAKIYNSDRYVLSKRDWTLYHFEVLMLICFPYQLCPSYFRLYPLQPHSIDSLTMSHLL